LDKAIAAYHQALAIDPKLAPVHVNLGVARQAQGKVVEAIAEFKKALQLDPKYAMAHVGLGNALQAQGKLDEAIAEYKKAIAIDPKLALAHYNLGLALKDKDRMDDAIAAYKKAITIDPTLAQAHVNLGIALKSRGKLDEAIVEYKQAITIDPKLVLAHYNLGFALAAQGKLDEAIAEYKKAIDLDPKDALTHGVLGQALLQQGRFTEARASTRRGLDLLPQRHPLRTLVTQQLRQCERWLELEPNLPKILAGELPLVSSAERLEYAQLCQLKKLYASAAELYAKTFTTESKLAGDLKTQHRYNAACYAALAGSGQGKDADKLDDQECARWRKQALEWLGADLTAYGKLLEGGKPEDRALVQQRLQHWRQDRDLSGLRDKDAVAKLPAEEREACQKLWADVEALLQKAQPQAK
jgi:tetratricopeptide (TPR) repeat protein